MADSYEYMNIILSKTWQTVLLTWISPFLDAEASLAPSPASRSVRDTFGFLFCLWALTKRQDDIVVADMEVDIR